MIYTPRHIVWGYHGYHTPHKMNLKLRWWYCTTDLVYNMDFNFMYMCWKIFSLSAISNLLQFTFSCLVLNVYWYKLFKEYQTSIFRALWPSAQQQIWPWNRSRHGTNWKGLSQGSCMPNIDALQNTSEDMSQVQIFVTDKHTIFNLLQFCLSETGNNLEIHVFYNQLSSLLAWHIIQIFL